MFQSTHLHEVWHIMEIILSEKTKFQSTHLHEVWLRYFLQSLLGLIVSIHTPTWGVTWCVTEKGHTNTSFNPHTYMRCDSKSEKKTQNQMFQSTHLHEVWRWSKTTIVVICSFNPHTYMRCDSFKVLRTVIRLSFNPHTYMRCDNA